MSAERAKTYLNDPLIQSFEKQMKDALFNALENANERDTEGLKNLCLMAKARKQFMGYLQSFLEDEKIEEFNKKPTVIDSVAAFIRRQK